MKKLIKDMKPGERMYTYVDGFDGGYRSKYAYSTLEEAKNAATEYVRYGIRLTRWEFENLIKKHENSVDIYSIIINEDGLTTRDCVYAGGDAVTGAATVISAMGAGKHAAKAIDEYLSK